jgi:hypothetical protein
VSTSWLAKKAAAHGDWAVAAQEIENGKRKHPYDFLDERGYIHQTAG